MTWSPPTTAATCPCGTVFRRPAGKRHAYELCLRCEFSARLAAAGITPDDPALTYIADWNEQAAKNAGDAVRAHEARANSPRRAWWPAA